MGFFSQETFGGTLFPPSIRFSTDYQRYHYNRHPPLRHLVFPFGLHPFLAERSVSFIDLLDVFFPWRENTMSVRTANNEAVVIREIEEVWNSDGDLDVIDDLVAKDVVYHSPMMDMEGRDEYREAAKEARTIFTDLEMSVEDVVPTDEKVAVRYIVRGTHSGEMMGIEPTDERIEMTGILIDRIEDGKIQERYDNADELGMFVQLGVVELPEMEEFEQ